MNIFEDFFNQKMTKDDFIALLCNVSELREGLEKFNKNSPEEYLTQIFAHILRSEERFRKEFLKIIFI